MATPPLPDVPCVRVRPIWNIGIEGEGGNRWYLSYSGGPPSGADCTALAASVAAAWATNLAQLIHPDYILNEVDVLDIASDHGFSGQWNGAHAGTNAGSAMPVQCAINVEFNIARRYRGGKPRMYLPPPGIPEMADVGHFSGAFVAGCNTDVGLFFTEVQATAGLGIALLNHVNLSYYKGTTPESGETPEPHDPPKYRAVALHDDILGYSTKTVIGSQKRRRTSTTP